MRQFDALAAGGGDADTVRVLRNAEQSKHLLRLRALFEAPEFIDPTAFDLLTELQRHAPDAVSEVLRYPHVCAWAVGCLQRMCGSEGCADGLTPDVTHLSAVAAVAAARSGVEMTIPVPIRQGIVALPSLGCAAVGSKTLNGLAGARSRRGILEIATGDKRVVVPRDPETDGPHWHGLRRLRATSAGQHLELYLDDLDPFRDRHGLGAASRLDAAEVAAWQRTLDDAWAILVRHHEDRAKAIATGLTTIVPLATRGRRGLSVTAADAPGAVAMTRPSEGLLLAEGLVHEFQHAKLGALLGLVPLYDTEGDERFYAPWRDDPRPIGGLLQGTYAYLAVTDFWSRQFQASSGADAEFAQFEFALWRKETWRTTSVLQDSGRLTPLGTRFVAGMRATLERLRRVRVSARVAALAEDAAADHAVAWRMRHVRPDPQEVDKIAQACPAEMFNAPAPTTIARHSGVTPDGSHARADLRRLSLRDPARFQRLSTDHEALRAEVSGATMGDLAHVQGDHATALRHYQALAGAEPERDDGWVGWAVTSRRGEADATTHILSTRPEMVAAVHRRVREITGCSPDALELMTWLEKRSSTKSLASFSRSGQRQVLTAACAECRNR
jgi:HEXXH motif-containing protein